MKIHKGLLLFGISSVVLFACGEENVVEEHEVMFNHGVNADFEIMGDSRNYLNFTGSLADDIDSSQVAVVDVETNIVLGISEVDNKNEFYISTNMQGAGDRDIIFSYDESINIPMDKIYFGGVKMFDKNLKYLRNKFNMEQIDLAHRLGRKSSSSVSEWEKGKYTPKIKTLAEIAQVFKVDLDDLMNADLSQVETSLVDKIADISSQLQEVRQQKVYNLAERELEEQRYIQDHDDYVGQTAAGAPIEGQQPVPMLGNDTVKLLVNGDSMEDLFHDGDIVEYHPQPELENGEIGVFAVNGGITLKRFRKNDDIRLESLNKKYEDIIIKESDDFNILGKVII